MCGRVVHQDNRPLRATGNCHLTWLRPAQPLLPLPCNLLHGRPTSVPAIIPPVQSKGRPRGRPGRHRRLVTSHSVVIRTISLIIVLLFDVGPSRHAPHLTKPANYSYRRLVAGRRKGPRGQSRGTISVSRDFFFSHLTTLMNAMSAIVGGRRVGG